MGRLADIMAQEPPPMHRTACGVGKLLEDLDEADRAELTQVLASRALSTYLVDKIEAAYGTRIPEWTLNRHRRGGCLCGRTA